MKRNWDFAASRLPLASWVTRKRLRYALRDRRLMPDYAILKQPDLAPRWTLFFAFLPDGQLKPWHRYTLDALRAIGSKLLVVCATPSLQDVPVDLMDSVDSLVWKSMPGYDFSAYAIGLDLLAQLSPGADVFVMNDSVFGPFDGIKALIEGARWELTGFTASIQYEAHIQSYAFILRNVTVERMKSLRSVFPRRFAYNEIDPIVFCFELRLARVASRSMSVGSFWLGPSDGTDPSIEHAFLLLEDGLPFLKRGLLSKHSGRHSDQKIWRALNQRGYVESGSRATSPGQLIK